MSLSQLEKTILSKNVIAGTVFLYYKHVEFPEGIYIALTNSYDRGIGSVINVLDHEECIVVPTARIDELILNIPGDEDLYGYIADKYGVTDRGEVTLEMEMDFWENYRWKFASEVAGTKIEWEN